MIFAKIMDDNKKRSKYKNKLMQKYRLVILNNESFEESETTIVVGDSKVGWAKAYRELIHLFERIYSWSKKKSRSLRSRKDWY